ncbi:MAG: flagellar biosynthesis regulator FlaF [Rhizobiaceae bacterium]
MAYRHHYAEIQSDGQSEARFRERELLEQSVRLMSVAMSGQHSPVAGIEARHFTSKIWTTLLQDLASSENQLPRETRAGLLSIGIWILRELDEIRNDEARSYQDIIDINGMVIEGLK